MLLMPTLKIGNPIQLLILVETNNFAGRTLRLSRLLHDASRGNGADSSRRRCKSRVKEFG